MKKITVREYPKYITECPGIHDAIDELKLSSEKIRAAQHVVDWRTGKIIKTHKELSEEIFSLTGRASLGLMNACAEWLIYRINAAEIYPNICLYTEAYWLRMLRREYLNHWERKWWTEKDGIPCIIGEIGMHLFEKANTDISIPYPSQIVSVVKFARYIVGNNKVFDKWFKAVLQRLKELYPRTVECDRYDFYKLTQAQKAEYEAYQEELKGPAVPREAYDPNFDFKIEMTDELIKKMLDEMKASGNPYLKTTDELIANGFKGTPYTWATIKAMENNKP